MAALLHAILAALGIAAITVLIALHDVGVDAGLPIIATLAASGGIPAYLAGRGNGANHTNATP